MKQTILLFLLLDCLNLNAQKGSLYQMTWTDAINEEKSTPADKLTFDKKGKLFYSLSNDNESICISIKVEESEVQSRILREGLIVWIDMDGKQRKNTGIHFPTGLQSSGPRGRNNRTTGGTNQGGTGISSVSLANTIELIGFPGENGKRIPAENADTFRGYIKYDKDGNLQYKLIIPVAQLPVRNSRDGSGAMAFNFGIEYGNVPSLNADHPGAGTRSSQGPPPSGGASRGGSRGGSSGGGRGGMSGGRGQGGFSNAEQISDPSVIFWIKKISLASGK